MASIRTAINDNQASVVLGNPQNFWLWSKDGGFDLTRPSTSGSNPVELRVKLQCAMTPVVIDPAKTALLIIDFQNYNVSKALGNDVKAYFDAEDILLKYAIPAARKAGIQVIWLTTGYSEEDLKEMDPGPLRTFNWHPVLERQDWGKLRPGEGYSNKGEYRSQKGVGDEIGEVILEDGTKIDAGRVLMRGAWNSWIYGRLADAYEEGTTAKRPDIHIYKNRTSGMCDKMTTCIDFLEKNNLRTLLFAGLNTDQCVMGTLQDAYLKGFDTILLKDGSATNSPEYAQLSVEYNCLRSWGFLSSCKDLADAVGVAETEG